MSTQLFQWVFHLVRRFIDSPLPDTAGCGPAKPVAIVAGQVAVSSGEAQEGAGATAAARRLMRR